MPAGNPRDCRYAAFLRLLLPCFLGTALLLLAACEPKAVTPPETFKTPSRVMTESGMEFFVWGLKLPGTVQELKLKNRESRTWLPLAVVQLIRLSGPVTNQYRQADIILTSGERLRGELFVSQIIEGTTDVGYWNTSLENVERLSMGLE